MRRICGWCGTVNVGDQTNCANCGGPLPAPPGADPGPAPEPAPRRLPGRYTRKLYLNFMVLFGLIFGGVGLVISLVSLVIVFFTPIALFTVAFGLFFAAFGGVFEFLGVRNARRTIRVLKAGRPTKGWVSDAQEQNGYWTLAYLYEVDGGKLGGSLQTQDAIVSQYHEGDALHVVYDARDPASSSVWPPIKLEI